MILSRLFRPKWQHADPVVRERAVKRLDASDPALMQVAREDADARVRKAALERLGDLSVLQQLAVWDADEGVRDFVNDRLRALFIGRGAEPLPLDVRLAALDQMSAAEVLAAIARDAREPQMRLAALERLDDDDLLAQAALSDPDSELRLKALERVTGLGALERIAKQSRKGDKRTTRRARERVAQVREQQGSRDRLIGICDQLESLVADTDLGRASVRLGQLAAAWSQLAKYADEQQNSRYQRAYGVLQERLELEAATRTQKQNLCTALEALERRLLNTEELSAELGQEAEEALRAARPSWEGMGSLGAAEDKRLAQRFSHVIAEAERRLSTLRQQTEHVESMRAVLGKAEQRLSAPAALSGRDLKSLRQKWKSLDPPHDEVLRRTLYSEFETLTTRYEARIQAQQQERERDLEELESSLRELEAVVEDGELQRAISLRDRVRHRLSLMDGGAERVLTGSRDRLRKISGRIEDLRGWRRWGTDHAREGLCEEVEALIGSGEDPRELAPKVRQARAAWQGLDKAEGSSSDALWGRFNTACNAAYEPCQAYFDQQGQRRIENARDKEVICDQLERLMAETVWDEVDWRTLDKEVRGAREHWRKIGPVQRSVGRELVRRYESVLEKLDGKLDGERKKGVLRRRELIARAEQLAESDDVRAAVEEVKRLQAQWRPDVLASRRQEQALWRQFRAACDVVFARRAAQYQEAESERLENLRQKTVLCDELAGFVDAETAVVECSGRVRQIRDEWESIGAVPEAEQQDIGERFRALLRHYEQRLQREEQASRRAWLDARRQGADICRRLEAVLESGPGADAVTVVQSLREEWQALGLSSAGDEAALSDRMDAVCNAILEGGGAGDACLRALEDNLVSRQELCLRMEILAGIDSPEQFTEARMAYQVSRLSNAFGGNGEVITTDPDAQAQQIEREWLSHGGLPGRENDELEGRFERARFALQERADGAIV